MFFTAVEQIRKKNIDVLCDKRDQDLRLNSHEPMTGFFSLIFFFINFPRLCFGFSVRFRKENSTLNYNSFIQNIQKKFVKTLKKIKLISNSHSDNEGVQN